MKKIFLAIVLAMSVSSLNAQTEDTEPEAPLEQLLVYENPSILVSIGEINYVPKSVESQVKTAVVSVVGSAVRHDKYEGTQLPVEDDGMVPGVKEALQTAVSNTFRMRAIAGDFTSEQLQNESCLKFTATITGCNTTVRIRNYSSDNYICITAFIYLTDPKTNEIVASRQVEGYAWGSMFSTLEDAEQNAIYNLRVNTIHQLNSWYPLRGHMLEKGFEKGKKQKLKEIFIDLGSDDRLGTGYTCYVYTVRRIAGRIARRYLGYGKVAEVMGADISSVTLKKGAKPIKEAFDKDAEIAVSVE